MMAPTIFSRLIFLFCLAISLCSLGQRKERDSLNQLLKTKLDDKTRVDILNALAYNNYDFEDSTALALAHQALELSERISYREGAQYANMMVGLGLSSAGNRKDAVSYFRRSDQLKSDKSRATTTYNLMLWAALYAELADYDSANLMYKKARANAQSEDFADLQSIYKNIAKLHVLEWKNQSALQYLDSASRLNQYGDTYMEMEVLSLYGLVYQNLLEFDKAKASYAKLCELAESNEDYYHKIECLLNTSRLATIQGEYKDALSKILEAITLASKYNVSQYVEVLTQLSEVYLELSQLELTGEYLFQALKISEAGGLKHKTAIIYNNLAWLTKVQRNYDEAISYTNKAQALMEEVGDLRGTSESYNVRGLTYLSMEKYSLAESQFKKALEMREAIGYAKGISSTMYNLADLYLEQERNAEALELLYKVVEIEKKIGNKPYLSMTYGLIARQLVRDKKYKQAFDFLEKARLEGEKDQSLYIQLDNAASYVFYYREIGDFKNAYLYQRKYQDLNDEIYDEEGTARLAEYEALYMAENREKEIELLNQKQKSQEAQIKLQESEIIRKNTVIIASILAAIIFAFAGFRIYKSSVVTEAANKKLVFLNTEISQQRDEIKKNMEHNQLLQGELEVKEKQYRDLIENASDIIHEMDENGRFTYVNPSVERITGFTWKELLGKHYSTFVHPVYVEKVSKTYVDQLKAQQEFSYHELPILSKKGETIWLGQSTRFFFRGDRAWKIAVVARDITKQRLAEEALRKSQQAYEELVETIPVGVYRTIIYPDGRFQFLFVSEPWCTMNGLRQADVLKNPMLANALIHPEDKLSFDQAEQRAAATDEFMWEGRMNVNGDVKYVRIESAGTRQPDGTIVRNGIQKDITERKLAEIAMLKAKEEAEKANASKSDFIANMSHEMRTPLNGVIGFTDLMMKSSLTATQMKYMTMVSQSAHTLLGMIDDVLDFSKIEASKLQLHVENFSVTTLCQQLTDMLQPQAMQKGIELTLSVAPTIPVYIAGDEGRLRQVLLNLLSNALKFTSQGKIELCATLVDSDASNKKIRFSVRDTGIGIASESQQKIFEAFVQEDLSITKKYGGTGLGLTIANRLLALMGSEIKLISEVGKGSTFYFDLPVSV
ncbi:MAG: PAS domain S-box protein [Cyclobacteriaceae bacterium]|nr:PAS domain S-box protein [Cyclobacteriaceae bacterium]